MKVVACSDFHGHLMPAPGCDLLLIAGDICPWLKNNESLQAEWMDRKFRPWMERQAKITGEIVWIAGNHDYWALNNEELARSLPGTYLFNESVTVKGLKIWGSPYSIKFFNWPFMLKDAELNEIWDTIPLDVQVILCHGPAYGLRDRALRPFGNDAHVGSQTLRNRIDYGLYPDLRLMVSGHIHEAWGHESYAGVNFVNPSRVDDRTIPKNPMISFDFDP